MIHDELKEKYNVLIAYERKFRLKHLNDGNYQQQYFYLNEQGVSVCSSSTFCRMEKNELLAEEDLYEFAAKKLGKKIAQLPRMEHLLKDTIQTIYICMERLEETSAAEVIQSVLPKLECCKDVLYYEEFLWQFEMMRDYFLSSHTMDELQFQRICHTYRIYPSNYQDILMRFAYLYSNIQEMSKKEMVLQLYNYKESKFLCNQICCVQIECMQKDHYQALLRCQTLEEPLIRTKNYGQLLTLYIHMFYLLAYMDKKASIRYLETALGLAKEHDYYKNRLFMLYINVGSTYLLLKEYEKSIENLKRCCELTDNMKMRNYLCICHCYRMLHKEIPQEYKTCPVEFGDFVDQSVYAYFQYVEERKGEQNKRFILHKVVKKLQKSDDLYLRILKDELHLLAIKTNRFKDYVNFVDEYDL